jgi:hypothetical protein
MPSVIIARNCFEMAGRTPALKASSGLAGSVPGSAVGFGPQLDRQQAGPAGFGWSDFICCRHK